MVSNLFETLGLQTREDWLEKGTKSRAFVRFNSLVTESIRTKSFRQLNYEKTMSYKSVIARQLHKRISHLYAQANAAQPYHIMLSTLIRDFGLKEYKRLDRNLGEVIKALEKMKDAEVISAYQVEKVLDAGKRAKMVDAKFILIPHQRFITEAKHRNKRHSEIEELLSDKLFES